LAAKPVRLALAAQSASMARTELGSLRRVRRLLRLVLAAQFGVERTELASLRRVRRLLRLVLAAQFGVERTELGSLRRVRRPVLQPSSLAHLAPFPDR
jgi:hypothetical protein